jgi:hypothetical protein
MSRIDRLKEYAKQIGPKGAGRDQSNLDYWARRPERNSELAPRARSGEIKLPDTNKPEMRDSDARPYNARHVSARMIAKDYLNVIGDSPYLRNVRRTRADTHGKPAQV